jgi:hypothetical protein
MSAYVALQALLGTLLGIAMVAFMVAVCVAFRALDMVDGRWPGSSRDHAQTSNGASRTKRRAF